MTTSAKDEPLKYCECGCGQTVTVKRRFVIYHNFRVLERSQEWNDKIAVAQKRAWKTKRPRQPIGAKIKTPDGYIRIKISEDSTIEQWPYEHIVIMEESVGRKLDGKEIVHHINGVRNDNGLENLYLCRDKSHHSQVHSSCNGLLPLLLIKGAIVFNRDTGKYEPGILLQQ